MSLPNKTNLLPDRPGIPPMAVMPEPETIDIPALAKAYADGDIDLICVLGPTASGKTRYAVQLARALGAQGLSSLSGQMLRKAPAPPKLKSFQPIRGRCIGEWISEPGRIWTSTKKCLIT